MQEATVQVTPSNWKKWTIDIVLQILVYAAILALFSHLRPLARPDSFALLEIAREMLANHNWVTPTLNNAIQLDYTPLFFWLTALSFKMFGFTALAARFWPGVFGIIGITSLYAFGYWYSGRRMGWLCAITLGSSALFLTISSAGNPYGMATVLLSSSLCCLFAASVTDSNRVRGWLITLAWALMGLNTLTMGLAGLLLPLIIITIYWSVMQQCVLIKTLFSPRGIFVFLIITLPWFLLVQKANPGFLTYYFFHLHVLTYFGNFTNAIQIILAIFLGSLTAFLPWSVLLNMGYWGCRPASWATRFERPLGVLILIWISIIAIYLIGVTPSSLLWISLLGPAFALAFSKALDLYWDYDDVRLAKQSADLLVLFLILLTALFIFLGGLISSFKSLFSMTHSTEIIWWSLYALILITGIICYSCLKRSGLHAVCIAFALTGIICTISCISLLPTLRQNSMQPVIDYLQQHVAADDVVANYDVYYPELSFYLHKPIVSLDWQNPPTYSTLHQDTSGWVVSAPFFWQTMQHNKRHFYIVAPPAALGDLQQVIPMQALTVLVQTPNAILLGNTAGN